SQVLQFAFKEMTSSRALFVRPNRALQPGYACQKQANLIEPGVLKRATHAAKWHPKAKGWLRLFKLLDGAIKTVRKLGIAELCQVSSQAKAKEHGCNHRSYACPQYIVGESSWRPHVNAMNELWLGCLKRQRSG